VAKGRAGDCNQCDRDAEEGLSEEPKMNVYQRINAIRKEVEYIKKDKKVGEGGYLAVRA